ncbi:MAG: hypothetical protein JWQ14_2412 [Adhaeribacter sp.]|nr:hypothetical protein [Adhaeribacter sp.]
MTPTPQRARLFLGLQANHETQIFYNELIKLDNKGICEVLNSISKWSKNESLGKKTFESYSSIYPGLGRWRINNYRIYTLHHGRNVYILLSVYKKTEQNLPDSVKEKIIKRAKYYEANLKETIEEKYKNDRRVK